MYVCVCVCANEKEILDISGVCKSECVSIVTVEDAHLAC